MGSYCNVCRKKKKRDWDDKNKDHSNSYKKQCYAENESFRQARKDYTKNYEKENRGLASFKLVKNSREASRRSRKLGATPIWLTKEQKSHITDFYWLAKDLEAISGQKYHVDHIVPLQGKQVCGLHVPWNLQVIPADINISKSNKV